MGFEVLRSAQVDADLEAIFDHLFDAYCALGEPRTEAFMRAQQRIIGIENTLIALGDIPHQGTLTPDILTGLRHVTKDDAVFYFLLDEPAQILRVLAVFFGGQDHLRHMLGRITQS